MTRRPSLLRLWLAATGFWAAAMLLRLRESCGGHCAVGDGRLWLGLALPPLVLGAVLATIYWFPMTIRRGVRR